MRLTVLGAGPAYTDRPGATGASYLVSRGDTHVLLDLGQGSLPRLFTAVPPDRLAAVVISHLHPDHFIDLVALRHYLRWEFDPPRRVRVLGPRGLADRLDALHGEPGFAAQALDTEVLGTDERLVGSLRVKAGLVYHTDESYGIRVSPAEGGPGVVYSGDCGRATDLAPLIEPGDTLLSEASYGPGPVEPGVAHLDGPAVGALAADAGVGRVLLTHLQMGYDPDETVRSVEARYAGPVTFVWPGSVIDLTGD
jgi:ribonuclease BN (tRNA processing enzyme)